MGVAENGSYATRAEMLAHLQPLREDIWEIKADVKLLVLDRAASKAVDSRNRFNANLRAMVWPTLVATVVGAIVSVGVHL